MNNRRKLFTSRLTSPMRTFLYKGIWIINGQHHKLLQDKKFELFEEMVHKNQNFKIFFKLREKWNCQNPHGTQEKNIKDFVWRNVCVTMKVFIEKKTKVIRRNSSFKC